jgi:hypothetical protein
MRNTMRVFGIGLFAMASLLTACGPVDPSAPEDQMESELVEPVSREATQAPPVPQGTTCNSYHCRVGAEGDAQCTSICGDVAKCFGPGAWCGLMPCCIML